ncbi:hypothetical protein [Moraxella equi]|uniref:Uncharacterized protein n=1 Tax=Moraxella equi TaxID=60442 RepID=A0A378QRJ6_9GAMM|nr:hypothetical protein [Moraxella equi]OPH36256.1 hypothetical protein B5J93_09365 [Moraxella equi]STZ01983.1 Uncharacterised protein [Moraxella equi]
MNLNTAKALIDEIGLNEAKNIAENEPSNAFIFFDFGKYRNGIPCPKKYSVNAIKTALQIVEQHNNPISDFDVLLAEIRECRIRTQNSDVVSMLDYLEHFAIGLKE